MAFEITDKEIAAAAKLAKRKEGVTRTQLAKALKITPRRAATVLERVKGAKPKALGGEKGGKAARALVYKM